MHVFVRNWLLAVCLLGASAPSPATNGIYLPPAPSGSGGEDSIETASGTRCRQSINNNGAYADLGVVGSVSRPPANTQRVLLSDQPEQQATVYGRVTIPLGKRPNRIDCSAVYELELQRLRREVELLKMAAE